MSRPVIHPTALVARVYWRPLKTELFSRCKKGGDPKVSAHGLLLSNCRYLLNRFQSPGAVGIEVEFGRAGGAELVAGIVGNVDDRRRQIGEIDALGE